MSHNPTWYRAYYRANKLKILERNEAWANANKEAVQQYRRNYYLRVTKPKRAASPPDGSSPGTRCRAPQT